MIVTFDPALFVARYPEFSGVAPSLLSLFFSEATLYLDNTDQSYISAIPERTMLLNMLTAHVATLNGQPGGTAGSGGLVGRIDSATEGSVSVSAKYSDMVSGTMAWYIQTLYGAAYWAATGRYRTMQYVGRQNVCRGYPWLP